MATVVTAPSHSSSTRWYLIASLVAVALVVVLAFGLMSGSDSSATRTHPVTTSAGAPTSGHETRAEHRRQSVDARQAERNPNQPRRAF
jgi:hypothetical protein